VSLFLCPSDVGRAVSETFGPTNYAACTGSGGAGGTPFDTDGLFFINSRVRPRDVTDGLSKTAAFSESLLGAGPMAVRSPTGIDVSTGYGFIFTTPLTEPACGRPFYYNFTDPRGFSWANGEYRTTLYNNARSSKLICDGLPRGADERPQSCAAVRRIRLAGGAEPASGGRERAHGGRLFRLRFGRCRSGGLEGSLDTGR